MVLGLEGADVGVRQSHVEECEQARLLPQVESGARGRRPGDPVPLQRGALDPEQRNLRLVGSTSAPRRDAVAAEPFDLVEICGVALVGHCVRRPRAELGTGVEDKRFGLAERRTEGERGARGEAILARSGALDVVEVRDQQLRQPVRRSQRTDRRGCGFAEGDAADLGRPVADIGERGHVVRFDAGDAGVDARRYGVGIQLAQAWDEHGVRRRGDRCAWRRASLGSRVVRVWSRPSVDGVEGIVDGHVRHGIQARLRGAGPFGREASGDGRFARAGVPGRDRIGRVIVVVAVIAGLWEAVLLPAGDALADLRTVLVGLAEVDPRPDARVDDLIDRLREAPVVAGADGFVVPNADVVGAEETLQRPADAPARDDSPDG